MKRLAIRYTGSTGTGYPFEEYTMEDKAYETLLSDYESFLKTQQPGGGTYELSEHGVVRRLLLNFAHITYLRLETASASHLEGLPGQAQSFPFTAITPRPTTTEEEDRPTAQPTPVSPKKPIL